jgi:hypothetical protein
MDISKGEHNSRVDPNLKMYKTTYKGLGFLSNGRMQFRGTTQWNDGQLQNWAYENR